MSVRSSLSRSSSVVKPNDYETRSQRSLRSQHSHMSEKAITRNKSISRYGTFTNG